MSIFMRIWLLSVQALLIILLLSLIGIRLTVWQMIAIAGIVLVNELFSFIRIQKLNHRVEILERRIKRVSNVQETPRSENQASASNSTSVIYSVK